MIMKFLIFFCLLLIIGSCAEPGSTSRSLEGNENNLPPELKGLVVYTVNTNDNRSIKVAILNNKINSTTYHKGKTIETAILLNQGEDTKLIEVSSIIMENDSFIICRKNRD